MSKQTAVEWLVEEMILRLSIRIENTFEGNDLIKKAKEIEKEQHEMTFNEALDEHSNRWFEQYYNETYKNS